MSEDAVIGVDIGTTYIKLIAISESQEVIESNTIRSPSILVNGVIDSEYPNNIFEKTHSAIETIIVKVIFKKYVVRAIAITGISPVIIAFSNNNVGKSIFTPYWKVPNIDTTNAGIDRTINRLRYIVSKTVEQHMGKVTICDLIGYINFRLTGRLSMNNITAGELGFIENPNICQRALEFQRIFPEIPLKSPTEICGVLNPSNYDTQNRVIVCAGAPDSFGCAIYSGATLKEERVLYLGTFGSILEVRSDIAPILNSKKAYPILPYKWLLSVPGYGLQVEAYAIENFPSHDLPLSLSQMDRVAANSLSGAGGVFFTVPSWDRIGTEHGTFGFVNPNNGEFQIPTSTSARAILEGLGHRIVASQFDVGNGALAWGVAGGGANSHLWLQILSDVIGVKLRALPRARGAWPAALIAGSAIEWRGMLEYFTGKEKIFSPSRSSHLLAKITSDKARSWYIENQVLI